MRCIFCGKKTEWEDSVGGFTILVCNNCVSVIAKKRNKDEFEISSEIMKLSHKFDALEADALCD